MELMHSSLSKAVSTAVVAAAISASALAQVDIKTHKLCLDARDYTGCIDALTPKPKPERVNPDLQQASEEPKPRLQTPAVLVSLDQRLLELQAAGSLKNLCERTNDIKECVYGIGEWKPEDLERVKMLAHACFDKCMLDVFGFYRDHRTGRDIPAVRTKDFDGAAPSRGFEVTIYPVAMRVFRYEGCAGCELTYQYPLRLKAVVGNNPPIELPMTSRGGYYIPGHFRRLVLDRPNDAVMLEAVTSEGEFNIKISSKALASYRQMLTRLDYAKVY